MLGNGCNDRNVILGVRGIQQWIETAGPWGNFARNGQNSHYGQGQSAGCHQHGAEQEVKLFDRQAATDVVSKGVQLAQTEYTQGL